MKSTEIEAEQVVSTSGLLTGRPNASSPQRVSASPWKTNTGTCVERPLSTVTLFPLTTLHSRQLPLWYVVHTVHNATPTQLHATQTDTCTSARRQRRACFHAVSDEASALRGRAWTPTLQSSGYRWATSGHFKPPSQRSVLKIQSYIPTRPCWGDPSPTLFTNSPRLYWIIEVISHINQQASEAVPFLKKRLFCHRSLDPCSSHDQIIKL